MHAALGVPPPPADHPWYGFLPARALPLAADRADVEARGAALARALREEGVSLARLEARTFGFCTECGESVRAKGLCSSHYNKARWAEKNEWIKARRREVREEKRLEAKAKQTMDRLSGKTKKR